MISIFISSFLNSIIILSYGLIFIKFFFKKNLHDVDPWIAGLYGFIFIGFISLTINFFLPNTLLVVIANHNLNQGHILK